MSDSVSTPTTFFSILLAILGLFPLQINFRITLPTATELTWDFDCNGVESTDEAGRTDILTTYRNRALSFIVYGNAKYNMATWDESGSFLQSCT